MKNELKWLIKIQIACWIGFWMRLFGIKPKPDPELYRILMATFSKGAVMVPRPFSIDEHPNIYAISVNPFPTFKKFINKYYFRK